jgi:hypothetical protein
MDMSSHAATHSSQVSEPADLERRRVTPIVALGSVAWVGLNLFAAYACRFWINSDTIGTLDSARALRSREFIEGLNGYFGTGFALLLTPVDLSAPESFLPIHLIATLLLLATQGLLYASLRELDLSRRLAAILSTVWAVSCHATGSAIFITADVPLCFWASLYVWVAIRYLSTERPGPVLAIASLGLIHAVAGITKAIAFPSLVFYPAGFALALMLRGRREGRPHAQTFRDALRFAAAYLIPLLIGMTVWALACHARYGQMTLGGTGTYNYARFTEESENLALAEADARKDLLPGKSFWWSDPMLSIDTWDHRIELDLAAPIVQAGSNIGHYLAGGKHLLRALVVLALLFVCLAGLALPGLRREEMPRGSVPLAMVGLACVGLYLVITVYPRHLTYPALMCLPVTGIALARLQERSGATLRRMIDLFLLGAVAHGVVAMLYASIVLAPSDALFRIADRLRTVEPGPIGVYLAPGTRIRSHGVIAFLAHRGAAEIVPDEPGDATFHARFAPEVVLWIGAPSEEVPEALDVDGRTFHRSDGETWRGGSAGSEEEISVYL